MKAIILAAGYGNRMRPLTDTTHKTLLRIGGQTLIGRILEGLRAHAVTDIVVVTGHLAEQLEEALTTTYPDLTFTFVRNLRYRETNNIYSLALAFEALDFDEDILLIESDLVYEPAVLKVYAERYLLEVPPSHPAYPTAHRLRYLVDRFVSIYPDHVPPTSLLREFIGGSGFEY